MVAKSIINSFAENPSTDRMPVLFIGHGNPLNAIEDNEFSQSWQQMGEYLPVPSAVLCVSAHWETRGTYITASAHPQTLHDFYGFPKELYEVNYPAPGNEKLAGLIQNQVNKTKIELDTMRGLDHGCWSVLVKMYPKAKIPVIQLSLNHLLSLQEHYQFAKELAFLRQKGVLILGSGNLVHNLQMYDFNHPGKQYDWALSINEKLHRHILEENEKILTHPEEMGLDFSMAAPTLEHYIPMLYVIALKENEETIQFFNDSILSSLSMTSFVIS